MNQNDYASKFLSSYISCISSYIIIIHYFQIPINDFDIYTRSDIPIHL